MILQASHLSMDFGGLRAVDRADIVVNQGEIVVDGAEELRTVEYHLDAHLSGKPTDSVNHWILTHVEHIPKAGERCHIDGLEVVVEKASRRRIRKVRLTCPIKAEPNEIESDSQASDEG